ncbi:benzoylformate decarboxylase [Mesorhizobium koreense]|uniref:benzoylformate decarboxylase n=1 Tax=Mesorhizobium koreense TaxID=3074855 RepID=UPI00287B9385|nr:benzoylformate decarboxylase [Mesorhizobium sp. WR6]
MQSTVRTATLQLLRELGMRTVFGNPGSTELAFLGDWPDDFRYILGLQESIVVAMADGYAQATGRPALVNLHSAAGVGHAMGSIFTAFKNQTPLVITAGQQARSLLALQPFLGAQNAAEFPKPYVKWSCEPARAEDVPLAIAQACEIAAQSPCGPTFVSIPSDDWARPAEPLELRKGSRQLGPDPSVVDDFAGVINGSRRPAIVFGPGVGREGMQELVTSLVEKISADVWAAPLISRDGVAQDHQRFAGFLPPATRPLAEALSGYDCVLVLGGPAFLLHVPDNRAVARTMPTILQITDDPVLAAASPLAASLIASLALAVPALIERLQPRTPSTAAARPACGIPVATEPLAAEFVMHVISGLAPEDAVFVEEAPSHRSAMQRYSPIKTNQHFYAMASGGLGFGLPAASGIALAHSERRVIAILGDGSAMYSIQGLWTAVQERLAVTFVVLNNRGYGAMRAFGQMMQTRNIPGIDVSGIDFTELASALGCPAILAQNSDTLKGAFRTSLETPGPTLIEVPIGAAAAPLYE